MNLSGRRVLVTGSSSGIGFAIAAAIRDAGGQVFVHGATPEKVAHAAAELDAPHMVADITGPDAAEPLVAAAHSALGGLDGLVNAAGIFPRGDLAETDAHLFDRVMATDARAPLLITRAAAARFREGGTEAAIVNIGSINALGGQSDLLAYSMAKAALAAMTRNLGNALGREGIRVNCLNVGWTFTETEDRTQRELGRPPGWQNALPASLAPSGRLLLPEEIARHAVFWLSPASAPVTGQVYEVEQFPVLGRILNNEEGH